MEHSANKIDVYLEVGKKQTIADAIEWPGWCRVGRDEDTALQALFDYGPRYGRIVRHVLGADAAYLARLVWKFKPDEAAQLDDELSRSRQAILDALAAAARGELPTHGPRGGAIWTPHYFVRRVSWHVLDHAWEIEDRVGKP